VEVDRAGYRFRVARGFLEEALQDVELERWRSAVDNAQLSVENAAKSVLALVGPVGWTHNPAVLLRRLLGDGVFTKEVKELVQSLAEHAEMLGKDIHIQTDYGDELGGRTPWELFDEQDARQALARAKEAVSLAEAVIQETRNKDREVKM